MKCVKKKIIDIFLQTGTVACTGESIVIDGTMHCGTLFGSTNGNVVAEVVTGMSQIHITIKHMPESWQSVAF